ncbi:MAG: LysM peptidoglycan-binding domain-containing protein [Defluviitaleaceae bacterium]|nr:LysM peptidoglycan-binding domain-containing protein [Defluviitaleaceae bacterium]
MSDDPKQGLPDGYPEGDAMDEIRGGFEEIYGNMEGFSKRAVESLFDDEGDEGYDEEEDDDDYTPHPVSTHEAGPPTSFKREADPDEEYAKYIRTAEKANRMDQEKARANRERAMMDRDKKLGAPTPTPVRFEEYVTGSRFEEEEDLSMRNQPARRQLNIRNLAALAGFLVLIVCAVLTWQIISARSSLSAAEGRISELEIELGSARIANEGLYSQLSQARSDNYNLQSSLTLLQGAGDDVEGNDDDANGGDTSDDADANGTTDAPITTTTTTTPGTPGDLPHTTINTAGNRIYTVQEGDSLWAIAARIYGNGLRFADILDANNMSESDNIHPGMILIIPD